MNFEYAVFDMDGTLLDSEAIWDRHERFAVGKICGVDLLTGEHASVYHKNLESMMNFGKELSGKDFDINEVLDIVYAGMKLSYSSGEIKVFDGAMEYLDVLKRKNIPIAVATATDYELCKKCLADTGLTKYIDAFISTKEAGKSKKFPDIYIKAMELIDAEKEKTMVFEDSQYCLETLFQNDFRYCIIDGGRRSADIPAEVKEKAELYIYTYTELIKNDDNGN